MVELKFRYTTSYESVVKNFYDITNDEPVCLISNNNKKINFQQVAIIPIDNIVYMILIPIDKIEGIGESGGLVFECKRNGTEDYLLLILDDKTIDTVFDKYNELAKAQK